MPKLLDLFCGAGGAAMGYYRAGWTVTGVDIAPQPNYPFRFYRYDALRFPIEGFDAVHASPPCQAYSVLRYGDDHPDLIPQTRTLLESTGLPFIIENVGHAPLRRPVQLCGSSFGLRVRRHRLFESNCMLRGMRCDHAWQDADPIYEVWNHGSMKRTGVAYVFGHGGAKAVAHWSAAMGIDWMTKAELAEAIPPAFTEHLGRQLLETL
jgi:DNA (cytosine-5)-methyltransferase 1